MKRVFLSLLIGYACVHAHAQEQLGMRYERWAGLYAAQANPAFLSFNPARFELSLFDNDFFLNQNYGRILNSSVPKILRSPELLVLLEDLADDPTIPQNQKIPIDFYTRGRAFGTLQGSASGPGLAFRVAGQHSIGLSGGVRTLLSAYRIPELFRFQPVNDFRYGRTYDMQPVELSGMVWSEIRAHYAYRNFDGERLIAVGITPKYLSGIQAFYVQNRSNFEYSPVAGDTADIGSGNWAYGFTTDVLYNTDPATAQPTFRGRGGAIDIGFSMAQPMDNSNRPEDYQWRLGVSILDLGGIRFDENAEAHEVQFDQLTRAVGDTLSAALTTGTEEGVRAFSKMFTGTEGGSLRANAFSMAMPTQLSLQFDYAIRPDLYIQGVWTQRLPLFRHSLKAPNTLAVVPRFERRWFSASLPIILSDYRSPRVGLAARLGVLYLGSDDVTSWTGKRSLTGTDFYIGLKINGFAVQKRKRSKHGRSGGFGGLRNRDRRWKDVGCFNQ